MDRLIYLFGALLMSGGIVVLLGITPGRGALNTLSQRRREKYAGAGSSRL